MRIEPLLFTQKIYIYIHPQNHRVHRVAMTTFFTLHHDGKISPAWCGWGVHALSLSLYLPSQVKLWCTLQLRVQIHSPYFSCALLYSVRIKFFLEPRGDACHTKPSLCNLMGAASQTMAWKLRWPNQTFSIAPIR